MRLRSWLSALPRPRRGRARTARPAVEALEARDVPAAGILDGVFGGAGVVVTPFDLGGVGQRNDTAQAIASQPDGKVVVAGSAQRTAAGFDFAIARYNRDGSLDLTFDGDGKVVIPFDLGAGINDARARAVAVLPSGKIVVAGSATTASGGLDFAVCRLGADGTPDATFDGDGLATVGFDRGGTNADVANDLVVQSDGKIVLVGSAATAGGGTEFAVCRLKANGTLDSTFSGDGKTTFVFDGAPSNVPEGVALTPKGKIVVAGTATLDPSNSHAAVARLTATGALDAAFDNDGRVTFDYNSTAGNHTGRDVVVQPDGAIVVAGESDNGSNADLGLARLRPGGTFDFSFDGDGRRTIALSSDGTRDDSAGGMLLQPDGKIVLAGHAPRETSGTVHTDLFGLRLNANGSLDSSYNGSGVRFYDLADPGDSDDRGLAVALTSDGIVIAGDQVGASGTDFAVARIRRDDWVVVSADRGGPPTVKVFTPTGTELFRFNAAGPSFKGGIRVAAGDVTGDGVLDLFTTPVSGAAVVKVWDGFTRQPVRTIEVLPGFTGGLSLAVGDVLGDTNVELLAAASKGRAPDVLFFDPLTGDPLKQVRVFNDNFRGSVRIATGNPVTATNKDELLVATGPPTAPVVRIFDGATDELKSEITLPAALGSTFQFAVGPVRNSSLDHLVITPGPGGPSVVRIFEFSTGTQVDKFTVFTPPLPGGLRVAAEQLNVAGPHEIVVAAGPGGPPTVKVLRGDTGVVLSTFRAFGASLTTGLFVLAVFR